MRAIAETDRKFHARQARGLSEERGFSPWPSSFGHAEKAFGMKGRVGGRFSD